MENGWIVIGISGATCSGKTTIANELCNKLTDSVLIHQDDYYYPVGSPKLEYIEELQHYNWDTLSAIDVDRLVNDVQSIIATPVSEGKRILIIEGHVIFNIAPLGNLLFKKYFMTVSKEVSHLRRCTRRYKRRKTDNISVLIIEGTLILNDIRLRDLCNLKYYLTLPYEISKERRYQKKYKIPDPPMNFDLVVWPHYLKHKSELINDTSICFIDSHENSVSAILHQVLRGISQLCLDFD